MFKLKLADRVERIKPSPSTTAAERAAKLRREGRSIINLAIGEPDFDTPNHIQVAATNAMRSGATRYTPMAGTAELRLAISRKLKRENDLEYAPDEVLVTSGAKSAIFTALAATIQQGDEVIVPAPFWVSYPDMVLACDGIPIRVSCPESDGFKLSPAALEKAITERSSWLLLNSPSNPTGAIYSQAELGALAQVLDRHPHVMVLTDDIYEHIQFGDDHLVHLLNVAPQLRERCLLVNGVSKSYAMTGWRIGYAAGPKPLLAAMEKLLSQSTGSCCAVSQAAATAALDGDQSFVKESVEVYRARRDRAVESISSIPGLSCLTPAGAFYVYVNCAGLIGKTTPMGTTLADDDDVAFYLLEQAGVATVSGGSFGLSPYFRISIATSIDLIGQGCERVAQAVKLLT